MTVKEAAEELGCSPALVYALFNSGELRGFRVRSKIVIPIAAVKEYISDHSNRPPEKEKPQAVEPAFLPKLDTKPKRRGKTPSPFFRFVPPPR